MQNSHTHQKEDKIKLQKKRDAELALKTITWPALASLTLTACGGGGGGPIVQPAPANRAPVAEADKTLSMDEDATNTALEITTPTDADGNSLTITVTAVPSGGTLATADGTAVTTSSTLTITQLTGLVFTPDTNLNDDTTTFGTFTYSVSDGSLTDSSTVTISITPVNDAPELVGGPDLAIDENHTATPDIGGTDVDGDALTYSISGGDDQALFTIDASTGALNFVTRPDYESPEDSDQNNSYLVEVTVTDPSGLTDTKTFTITVNDVITHVAITNNAINENDAGATVGTLSAAIDDINAAHEYTYTLSGTNADSFEIVNGQLKLKDSVSANYESQNSYSVTVTATDTGGLTKEETFTVTVNNLNDDPTLANAIADQSINEDSAFSFTVPADTFNDEDGDTLTYTATLSDSSALPSWLSFDALTQTFSGTPLNGDVGSISITVTATDAAGVAISDTFTIAVANTNDAPTLVNAIANQDVNEDSAFSFTIAADTFNDVDVSDTLTYTATLSNGSALPSWLSFDASTQIFSGTPLNADVGSISVQVTATDVAGVAISDTFAIAVANTNDAPTAIALSSLGIPEKIDGAVIGTLTTSDVDVGDTHTYTVSDDRFEVVDGQLKLKAGNTVEYATEATITLTVTTTDAAGESFDQEFTLTVGSIQISATTFAENAAGAVVGDLSITDPDFTANVTYTLSGTDVDSFEVVNNQLKLKDSVSADFETKNTYSITITATDDAGHEATLTYSLQVTDINEAPTAVALSATAIDENAAGAVVGTLTTTDVDAGDSHTYTLSGTNADSFEIVNGQLKLKDTVSADYETQTSYSVTVTATDSGGLTTEETFTVTVNNLNDNDPIISSASSIDMAENSNEVGTVNASDADGDTLTYSITGGADAALFTINPTTGALTLHAKTFDLATSETSLPFKLTNMVDNGDGTYTVDIEVDPSLYSYAALGGITIEFSFDSNKVTFNKDNIDVTADGGSLKNNLANGNVKLVWYDQSGVNTFTGGKLGTLTFTPTVGQTDPQITIIASMSGGELEGTDSIDSVTTSTVYTYTEVRTNVDFENPSDANTDNIYEVTVQVSDGTRTASQDIQVTVTDVAESSSFSSKLPHTPGGITDPISDNDDTPVTPTNNDPLPDLPDWSLWMESNDLSFITLPETVTVIEDSTLPDMGDLVGLLGDQGESLELDFDAVDTDSPVLANIESVKPVIVDWNPQSDPFIDSDWNPVIEELFYTAEVNI